MSDINKVLQAFAGVRSAGQNQWKARCPCHDDKKASLTIKLDDDKILLHDFAGCDIKDILHSVGLNFDDLQPDKEKQPLQFWEKDLIDKYDYKSEDGTYLYSKLRYERSGEQGKDIRYARIKDGKYTNGKGNNCHVLYRLPELVSAVRSNKTIFYAEGEKDVNTLVKMGLVATTAGGTDDWRQEYAHYFVGTDLVILGDNDKAGRDLVNRIKNDLREVAFTVKALFPSEQEKGDITDYIEEGHSRNDLLNLVNKCDVQYATWFDSKRGKINAGLLANVIMKQHRFILAMHPEKDVYILHIYKNGVYRAISENEVVDIIRKYIPIAYLNPALLRNVAQLISYGAQKKSFEELNTDEHYINVRNGLLNIKTWQLENHGTGMYYTVQINARYKEQDAPLWNTFIEQLCTNEEGIIDHEEINVLQELSGLIVSNIYGYRLKKAYMLYSPEGNTGKSVYLNVIEYLLGLDAYTVIDLRKLSASRWVTGDCFNKRLVAVGDQGAGEISDSSVFKKMTGNDPVEAEFKGMPLFKYKFKGIIVLACNQLPYFSDDKGNHIADRLMLLPCMNVISPEKRDPIITEKLLKEKDGILFWCIEGLKRLLDNGLHFSHCSASEELMKTYRASHDTLYDFISRECEQTGDKADYIRKKDFEDAYILFCQKNNLEPLLKRNIKLRAASLGIRSTKLDGYDVYRGIRFLDFIDVEDDDSNNSF